MRLRPVWRVCGGICGMLLLFGCSSAAKLPESSADNRAAPVLARGYKVGKPYQIKGVWYYPQVDYNYIEDGVASWYGPGFHGKATANGESYDMNDLTAAHRTLPMPSVVRVTNLENGRSLKLKVNDRGPFARDRIIDVSRRASQLLGFHMQGTAQVRVEIIEDESRMLAAALGVPSEVAWAASRTGSQPAASPQTALVAELSPPPVAAETVIGAVPEPLMAGAEPSPVEQAQLTAHAVQSADISPPDPAFALPASTEIAEAPSAVGSTGGSAARWVQAGAFADPGRAAAAQRRLAGLGPTITSSSLVGGRELLRVRVGPLGSEAEAQRMLASVSEAGFRDSRIVAE